MLTRFDSTFRPIIHYIDPAVRRARNDGRSYWQVRYRDGRIINEYDRGADWILIPRQGLIGARLICPSGDIGVLESSQDCSDRLFQFKIGALNFAASVDPITQQILQVQAFNRSVLIPLSRRKKATVKTRETKAHVLGLLVMPSTPGWRQGDSLCYAWEWPGRMIGPFNDTFPNLQYGGPATDAMDSDILGVKPD